MVSNSDVKQGGSSPKRRRIRRLWYVALAALLAVLMVTAVGMHSCTLATAYSGVSFDLKSLLAHTSDR